MKRILLTFTLTLAALVASAVPAKPGLTRTLTLADGSTVTARLVGDEHGHFWLGADGRAYQATDADGSTSAFTARAIDLQSVRAHAHARRSRSVGRRARRLAPRRVGSVAGSYTGPKRGLIILVNFDGTTFKPSDDNALYQRIANEPNFNYGRFRGSMYDYFLAQSDGQFQLTFDVVGPVNVSHRASYYGANDSEGNDKYPATMVIEALEQADPLVNYADYDWDADGEVDQVYVVYAGKGEADGGAASTIWPHEWTLSEASEYADGDGPQTLDGVRIDTYACGPELDGQTGTIAGIGTMCHEFSHCLGFPDFYDTDYSGGQGMFCWDLMDSGSYNDDGFLPAGYTSYERWVAGWMEPVELTATTAVTDLGALQLDSRAYIIYNKGHREEYFLLENRQQVGWDAGLPGAGLLILHVDYDEGAWADNTPNDNPRHQRMTWVAADNEYQYTISKGEKYFTEEGAANDPFPYGTVNAFGPATKPAAKFNNRNADGTYFMDSSIEDITQNADGTIGFRYRTASTVAAPVFAPKGGRYAEPTTVSLTCATEGATIYYTTDGTTPTAASTPYTEPFVVAETTTVKAVALTADDESTVAVAKYTIGEGASNPDTKTFRLVPSAEEMESGMRYVIACGSKQTAASGLGATYLGSRSVTLADDIITIDDGVAVFVLEETPGEGWTVRQENTNKYLYATEARKLAESTSEQYWMLTNGEEGVEMSFADCGTMTYNASSPRFTTYTSSASARMIRANLYMEYSDESGQPVDPDPVDPDPDDPDPEEPAEGTGSYHLVGHISALLDGDRIVLTYTDEGTTYALSTTQKPNNRAATTDVVLHADGTLTPGPEVQVITLEKEGDCFLFNVGNGYLYAAASGSNYLRTEQTPDDNALVSIALATDESRDATIQFQGPNANNYLRFNPNKGTPLFSCYASSSSIQNLPHIYRFIPDVPTAVGRPASAASTGVVYDLTGRRVVSAKRGIYIVGGKKVVVGERR